MKREKIKEQLLALKANDGMIHAAKVVAWASKHRTSELGRQFTWANDKAAHEYRLYEARRLIMLHIVTETKAPQLVSLRFDRARGGGYRAIDEVLESKELSSRMLDDAIADLDRVRARHETVKELTSVWQEVDRVRPKRAKRIAEERLSA